MCLTAAQVRERGYNAGTVQRTRATKVRGKIGIMRCVDLA